jgi:hypothetical protein
MGLFKKAWQSNNEEKALRAVKNLLDQNILVEIVKDKRCYDEVKRAAIERLTNKGILADIANDCSLADYVREAAIERLTDQSVLIEIAKNDNSSMFLRDICRRATEKLKEANQSNQDICIEFLRMAESSIISREVVKIEQLADKIKAMPESIHDEYKISMKTYMITENEHDYTSAKINRAVTEFYHNGKLVYSSKRNIN